VTGIAAAPATEKHGGRVFEAARRLNCDWREILDFSANINPLGPPSSALAAIAQSLERLAHYPEIGAPRLRRAAARFWGVGEENVLAGNGAVELIFFLARTLRPEHVVLEVPTFSEYRRAFAASRILAVPAASSIEPAAGLTIVTRPNNPTGGGEDRERMLRWVRSLPAQASVLVDESFVDFASDQALTELIDRPGVFLLRSLTKFFALPGLRVGCLLAHPQSITELQARREPWQVSAPAEDAATAALADIDYVDKTRSLIAQERVRLTESLAALQGLSPRPSLANFVFCGYAGGTAALSERLVEHKILIRDCSDIEGVTTSAFRVAVRGREENDRLIAALKEELG